MQEIAHTIYYDGACPVCSAEIKTYQRLPGAEQCQWVDASACHVDRLGPDLPRCEALSKMTVRTRDGRLLRGAAAFVAIWTALDRTRPLARLAALPPVMGLLEFCYTGFLKLRPLWRRP